MIAFNRGGGSTVTRSELQLELGRVTEEARANATAYWHAEIKKRFLASGQKIYRARGRWHFGWVEAASLRRCRKCGCSNELACEGGCSWVAADLCSACVVVPGALGMTRAQVREFNLELQRGGF